MLRNLLLFLLISFSCLGKAQVNENSVLGKWMATDKSVMVEISKNKQNYSAKIIWFDDRLGSGKPMHSRHDTANPNPALRNRKILGMDVLTGMIFNSKEKRWENGKIYDAYHGRTWDSSAEILPDGKLKVRGFWKLEWIGKSMFFYKVS